MHFGLRGIAKQPFNTVYQMLEVLKEHSEYADQVDNFPMMPEYLSYIPTGTPGCVIRTTNVRVIPYAQITFDIAKLEGEDDALASWQANHRAFFEAEGQELGYPFSEDMPVIFAEFEVVETL